MSRTVSTLLVTAVAIAAVFSGCSTKKRPEHRAQQVGKDVYKVRTTAYSHLENEPGAPWKKTAAGTKLRYGKITSAAADWSRFPLGTKFKLLKTGRVYEIEDYGSALVGTDTVDLYMPRLRMMNDWGVRHVEIKILEWGSYEKSADILKHRTKYKHCRQMYQEIQKKL
ncbi:MAG: 3D domain-containing protein [Verrucomicrobiota bacterium]